MENIIYYITYDLPIPYKNILIYPATVKDYMFFMAYSECFSLDKNSIPDAKIISMTELEYIYYLANKRDEERPYLLWFDRVLSICLKDDNTFEDIKESVKRYLVDENEKPFFIISGEKYTANLLDLPDENISKEVRDSLEKAKEYKNRMSGTKAATLEDYILALATVTGWSFDYIYSMSIRKFTKSLKRLDNYIHYKIYLSASMSGMVKFEDRSFIKHWLTNIEEDDKFKDVSVDLDAVQNTVSLESAKNKK
jgi:hypothetical protein